MTISNEAIEAAKAGIRAHAHIDWQAEHLVEGLARAALEAAAGIIRAECLEEAAKELAQLPYVKPGHPDRAEYERVLAVRRGNADAWLRARAVAERNPPMSARDLLGIASDFTGGLSVDEYMDRERGRG